MKITLSKEQATVIAEACELLLRVHIGQIEEPLNELLWHAKNEKLRNAAESFKDEISKLKCSNPKLFVHLPVHLAPERAKIALDVHTTLRHWLAWDKSPQGGYQVWFDEPRTESQEAKLEVEPQLPGDPETRERCRWKMKYECEPCRGTGECADCGGSGEVNSDVCELCCGYRLCSDCNGYGSFEPNI